MRHPNLSLLARDGAVAGGRKGKWHTVEEEPDFCELGDFSKFGDYLRRIVGRTTESSSIKDTLESNTDAT